MIDLHDVDAVKELLDILRQKAVTGKVWPLSDDVRLPFPAETKVSADKVLHLFDGMKFFTELSDCDVMFYDDRDRVVFYHQGLARITRVDVYFFRDFFNREENEAFLEYYHF